MHGDMWEKRTDIEMAEWRERLARVQPDDFAPAPPRPCRPRRRRHVTLTEWAVAAAVAGLAFWPLGILAAGLAVACCYEARWVRTSAVILPALALVAGLTECFLTADTVAAWLLVHVAQTGR